jgi:xylulokinase
MAEEAGEEVLRRTGCAPSFNHGPKILWWKDRRPQEFRAVRSFVQPGGYAAMRLTGLGAADAFIDWTYLHFSGFADNPAGRWDEALAQRFGLDAALLPRIVEPHSVVGELSGAMARRAGLAAGTAVVAGCGDTAASFLACGATEPGISVDVAGTASVFASTAPAFRPDVGHRVLGCGRAATPGLWHPYACINGGGMNVEWFLREVANRGGRRGRAGLKLQDLDRLAARLPLRGTDPFFVPHMEGRVCPGQPHLRGAWAGLSWSHTLGHLYRAVLESVALEYAIYRRILAQLYPGQALREVRITGGGARSRLWNRLKAAALQTPVLEITGGEGAPMGAAMVAAWGAGLVKDLPAAAARWVRLGRRHPPDARRADYYRRRAAPYRRLLEAMDAFGRRAADLDEPAATIE